MTLIVSRKLIALVLIFTFVFALPVSTMAIDIIPPIPVSDSALRDKEAGVTMFGFTVPGLTWDLVAITIAKLALEQILNATTAWINNGFEGNPAYVTDPLQFFTKIADNIAGEFIQGSELGFLCSPFQAKIRLALARRHAQRRQFQCTLTNVVANIEDFYNDFSQGGWDAWFVMTQNDVNNPYGAFLETQIELDERLAQALGLQNMRLSWDSGFLGWSECIREDPDTGECIERGPTKTPGKVIESQLENVLGSGVRQLELADEFDELVAALFSQLLKQIFSSAQGLFNGTGFGGNASGGGGGGITLYTLDVYKSGTGSGTVISQPAGINCGSTCAASFPDGASVTLTAIPAIGSTFTKWFGGACSNQTSPTCVLPMTAVKNTIAIFD
ncbi:MAG: hypothetical protein UV94_C0015G0007 [Parcubacteria group bacterium GW2011_GWC1_43_30]|nr:MAG: hypothetical protein UV94_C0015G0007 [Parcubacteria group bacterium GW2011_GWC1_43_30]